MISHEENARMTNNKRALTTIEHKRAFLEAYAHHGNVSATAAEVDIDRSRVYDWLKEDSDFAAALEQAKLAYSDWLQDIVNHRLQHPEYGRGSDMLLIAAKNAADPAWARNDRRNNDASVETILEVRKRFRELASKTPAQVESDVTLIERRRLASGDIQSPDS